MSDKSKRPFWSFSLKSKPVVALVRLKGAIGMSSPLRPGLTLETINPTLERAFAIKKAAAVAIVVNSPGGSPVQSALIHDRIRQLAEKENTKVIAFCEDVAASGGYWLALAGDEIFADAASIIGSIGVVAAGFGFPKAMARLGIERRVYTAGKHKVILDPFQEEKKADVARLRQLQKDIHESFKTHVRARRGDRLKGDQDDLFSGAFWTGKAALERGLIDGLGHAHEVLAERFGKDVKIKTITAKRGLSLRRFLSGGGAEQGAGVGAGIGEGLVDAAEVRALWQRYGL